MAKQLAKRATLEWVVLVQIDFPSFSYGLILDFHPVKLEWKFIGKDEIVRAS